MKGSSTGYVGEMAKYLANDLRIILYITGLIT